MVLRGCGKWTCTSTLFALFRMLARTASSRFGWLITKSRRAVAELVVRTRDERDQLTRSDMGMATHLQFLLVFLGASSQVNLKHTPFNPFTVFSISSFQPNAT